MSDGTATEGGTTLEQELERMLEIERFDPPEAFREHALLRDPSIYQEAAADPQGWWATQAEALDWFERWVKKRPYTWETAPDRDADSVPAH